MPHLTRTVQKSIFKTDMGPRPAERAHPIGMPYSADHEHRDERLSVAVDMTPGEALCTRMSNYPRYDLLDTQNLPPRVRGKHY